jgi:hypothetical protein
MRIPIDMVITKARTYLTANASIFSSLFIGDQSSNTRYIPSLNLQTQALNTWIDWTPVVPQFIVSSALEGSLVIGGTAGLSTATGIFEIEGYIP